MDTAPSLKIFPPPKTSTYSNIHSHKGIYSAATPSTLLLIPSTPNTTFSTTTTFTSMENIKVYLAITIFIYVNIVYK